ncbi:hypothetical protein [Saccharothrix sp. ST-888]|uniref:hypothetical protein n=1 Tax=Saccharothrix sp. ST-888 TaxID=1427391 RepID=UPI0012E04D0C|nr:hypothetical protein [Saccharothrix sp. ST-888]
MARAVKDFDARFWPTTVDRLSHLTCSRLDDLVAGDQNDQAANGEGAVVGGGRSFFTELKTDPGRRGWRACWPR